MDRMFVLQREWLEDKSFPDPKSLERLFDYRCPYFLDRWTTMGIDDEPAAFIDDLKAVPIGTIQFVSRWLEALGGKDSRMTPLEVPRCLRRFAGREYFIAKGSSIPKENMDGTRWFIKDADHLKKWNSLLYDDRDLSYFIEPDTLYAVSSRVSFASEYRVFVYEDEIQECEHYLYDPAVFPDGKRLKEMVSIYSEQVHPKAYTLDIGILEENGQTVPLEIHPFACCGLYGFNDSVLLDMYEAGWDWYMSDFSKEAL